MSISFVWSLGVAPTMRDSELVKEADEIRVKYKEKAASLVQKAVETWIPTERSVRELKGTCLITEYDPICLNIMKLSFSWILVKLRPAKTQICFCVCLLIYFMFWSSKLITLMDIQWVRWYLNICQYIFLWVQVILGWKIFNFLSTSDLFFFRQLPCAPRKRGGWKWSRRTSDLTVTCSWSSQSSRRSMITPCQISTPSSESMNKRLCLVTSRKNRRIKVLGCLSICLFKSYTRLFRVFVEISQQMSIVIIISGW